MSALTHLTDLDAAVPVQSKDADLVTELSLPRYCQAQGLLLDQVGCSKLIAKQNICEVKNCLFLKKNYLRESTFEI